MSWGAFAAVVGAIVLAVAAIFKAGESKGKKKEQLAGAEEAFVEVKEEADVALEEQMAESSTDRLRAAVQHARERLARRGGS